MRTQRLILLGGRRPTATVAPEPGTGSYAPIGADQTSFNESVVAWDGLDDAPLLGVRYAPVASVDTVGGIAWGNSSFQTNALHCWGAYELEEPAESILTLNVPVRCGASAGGFRFGLYADNGQMDDSATDIGASGSYPAALVVMSAQQSLSANTDGTEWSIAVNTGPVAAGYYYGAFWRSGTSSGVEPIIAPSGAIARQWRASSTYSSGGAAPSTFPGGASGNERMVGLWWATYRPVAPTSPTLSSATAINNRSVRLVWTGTDTRATRYRVERRKNGGSWVYAAIVEAATSYTDLDLEAGATYEYRVVALYKNAQSAASNVLSAVATGVRTATLTVTPTLLIYAPNSTLRGCYGLTHNLTGNNPTIAQQTGYKRTGGTEWGEIQPTSSPSYFDWSAYSDYLNDLGSKQRGILRTRHAVSKLGNKLPPFVTANSSYYSIANESDGTTTWFANLSVAQVWVWAQAWIASFGANFRNDERVILVKVGIHNRFGEWSGSMPAAAEISQSRMIEIVQAMQAAFPNKKLIMSCTPDHDLNWYCVQQDQIVAFEQLSLGDQSGPNQWRRFWADIPPRVRRRMRERRMGLWTEHKATWNNTNSAEWLISEHDMEALGLTMLSDRNMSTAAGMPEPNNSRMYSTVDVAGYRYDLTRAQLPAGIVRGQIFQTVLFWRNSGNGAYPPVEVRRPEIELWQGGARVWRSTPGAGVDLTKLYPSAGATAAEQTHNVEGIAPGTYDLCLRVPPADTRSPDLELGISGRQSDGRYILASNIQVT
jgi:hypothetical protein